MTETEKAKLPPPPICTTCSRLHVERIRGLAYHHCESGHPMHNGCTWHKPQESK